MFEQTRRKTDARNDPGPVYLGLCVIKLTYYSNRRKVPIGDEVFDEIFEMNCSWRVVWFSDLNG